MLVISQPAEAVNGTKGQRKYIKTKLRGLVLCRPHWLGEQIEFVKEYKSMGDCRFL